MVSTPAPSTYDVNLVAKTTNDASAVATGLTLTISDSTSVEAIALSSANYGMNVMYNTMKGCSGSTCTSYLGFNT